MERDIALGVHPIDVWPLPRVIVRVKLASYRDLEGLDLTLLGRLVQAHPRAGRAEREA